MIEPLSSGNDLRDDFKAKINEIVAWINTAEKCKITPDKAGKVSLPGVIDLSGLVTKAQAREAGLNV